MSDKSTPSPAGCTSGAPFYRLRLFVAGDEPNSVQARHVLTRLCEAHLSGRCAIEIVDVFEDYHAAIEHGIYLVPALKIESPPPARTVVGSLSDEEKVLQALGIAEKGVKP